MWHEHADTDEFFLVLKGRMVIQMRDGNVELDPGERFVVPKGIAHRPRASDGLEVLLIEPAGTVNTGNAGGELTAVKEHLYPRVNIAPMQIDFVHDALPGRVSISCEPNDDPHAVGKPADAGGFPMCSATIDYPGRGYRSLLGWIQLVRSTDNATEGAEFEIDPARFFEDSPAPFCFYGFAPTFFDAPSRDDWRPLDWLAHAFLAFVPRENGIAKTAQPLLGFSWGFRIDHRARLTLAQPKALSMDDWLAHLPYMRATYPTWHFPRSGQFGVP